MRARAAVLAALILASPMSAAAAADPPGVGDAAPALALPDHGGTTVRLDDFRGKRHVLLAFYPAAFSQGCTNEMRCLGREWRDLDALGIQVLGISADAPATLVRFRRALGLTFPLLSDADLDAARAYGVAEPSPEGAFHARSVFLIDREGVLRHVDRDFKIPTRLEGTPLLAAVRELGRADRGPPELEGLPSPEREAKALLFSLVGAVLDEDMDAIGSLLHADFARVEGEPGERTSARRKERLDDWRTTFENAHFERPATAEVVRVSDARVFTRDEAAGKALEGRPAKARALAALLRPGDLLVCVRGPGLRTSDGVVVLGRDIALAARREGDAWRIVDLVAR